MKATSKQTARNRSKEQPHKQRKSISQETSFLPGSPPGFRARILGWISAWLLRIQWTSWRKEVEGLDRMDEMLARGQRILVTFWHGKYVPLFALLRGQRACVFASQSFRGDVIAEICRNFGYHCVQIPDSAGDRSLDLMRRALAANQTGAIAVDGPLGPYHAVKRGAIQLASDLGFVLLPASVASRRKRVLIRRWDRMEIPRLFTRVCLVVGEAIEIPAGLSKEEIGPWIRRFREALEAADRRAEKMVKSAMPENPFG